MKNYNEVLPFTNEYSFKYEYMKSHYHNYLNYLNHFRLFVIDMRAMNNIESINNDESYKINNNKFIVYENEISYFIDKIILNFRIMNFDEVNMYIRKSIEYYINENVKYILNDNTLLNEICNNKDKSNEEKIKNMTNKNIKNILKNKNKIYEKTKLIELLDKPIYKPDIVYDLYDKTCNKIHFNELDNDSKNLTYFVEYLNKNINETFNNILVLKDIIIDYYNYKNIKINHDAIKTMNNLENIIINNVKNTNKKEKIIIQSLKTKKFKKEFKEIYNLLKEYEKIINYFYETYIYYNKNFNIENINIMIKNNIDKFNIDYINISINCIIHLINNTIFLLTNSYIILNYNLCKFINLLYDFIEELNKMKNLETDYKKLGIISYYLKEYINFFEIILFNKKQFQEKHTLIFDLNSYFNDKYNNIKFTEVIILPNIL